MGISRIEHTEPCSVFVLAFLVICSSDWRGVRKHNRKLEIDILHPTAFSLKW